MLGPAGQELLEEVRDLGPEDELAAATRLRKRYEPGLVAAAMAQGRLRQRAAAKFGPDAARMYFTPNGVEQATRRAVAEHRAARFAALGARRVLDLCGGIGGDALALARAGIAVVAVDRDPLTVAVARANAISLGLADLIEVRRADVMQTQTAGYDAVFADPARRTGRGRTFDPEAYEPPLSWALAAARTAPYAAVKVAPGIPHEAVPQDAEAEWVSDHGDVKEAALWFGTAPGAKGATLLPSGARLTAAVPPPAPPIRPVGRFLYEPDGAVVRAHLVAAVAEELGGGLIDASIAYVTADEARPTAYATPYEITDVLPFGLKRLKALLRERGVGVLTVKKRGSAVEPEEVRRRVRPQGPHRATVFLTRVAGAPSMLIGQPLTGS
nr:methyltransferase [Actinacidiphila acididurans]